MKLFKRSCVCLCLIALFVLCLLPKTALAAEGQIGEGTEATATATTTAAVTAFPEGGEDAPEGGAAALLADFLATHAAGLISGATFLLTLAISYLFRRRLIPPLLESLSTLLGKSRDALDGAEKLSEQSAAEAARLLLRVEELLASATEAAHRAEEAADAIRAGEAAQKTLSPILREQVDLLYELLISANLPQYQKDKIGAAHAAAMALLSEDSHE